MEALQSKRAAPEVEPLRAAEEPPTKRSRTAQKLGQKPHSDSSKAPKGKEKEERGKEVEKASSKTKGGVETTPPKEKEGAEVGPSKGMKGVKKVPDHKERAHKASEDRPPREKGSSSSVPSKKGKEKVEESDCLDKQATGRDDEEEDEDEEDPFVRFLNGVYAGPPNEGKNRFVMKFYKVFHQFLGIGKDFRLTYLDVVHEARSLKSLNRKTSDALANALDALKESQEGWSRADGVLEGMPRDQRRALGGEGEACQGA